MFHTASFKKEDSDLFFTERTSSDFFESQKIKPSLKARATEIFECLTTYDINKLIQILSKLENDEALDLVKLVDESGHTLIIRAAYDNTHKISEYLIFFYKTKLARELRSKEQAKLGLPEEQNLPEASV